MEEIITVRQVSKIMGVHPLTVRRRIEKNPKYWFKFKGGKNAYWRIEKSNFEKWLKEVTEQI